MIGTRLGQYRIDALLGQGGMGAVYLATDEMLGRQVAIKVLREQAEEQAIATERFRSEAQILSRLDHPHILRLYGFSQHEGLLYMVTEFVRGEALQRRLERGGPVDSHQVLEWAGQVLDALDYAHQLDVVHRDIKPANILIDERGRARLLDFGIARIVGAEGPTQTGQAVGTLTYMAPEQVLDEPIDGRADIYAFAVVLCQMLAGRRPYRATTTAGLIREIVDGPTPEVAALLPPQSAALAPPLIRALARHPADRTPTAGQLRLELIAAATQPELPPLPVSLPQRGPASSGSSPVVEPFAPVAVQAPAAPVITSAAGPSSGMHGTVPVAPSLQRRQPVAVLYGLVALLLLSGGGLAWYLVGPSRPSSPPIAVAPPVTDPPVDQPAGPTAPNPVTTDAPAAVSVTPTPTPAEPPPAPVAPVAAEAPSARSTPAPPRPAPPATREAPPRVAASPAPSQDAPTSPATVAETPPPPAPSSASPAAPPAAPAAASRAAVPATVQFKDIILIDRIDDEDEEIDVSMRLDARRIVVIDEDGIAKRSIAYEAIDRASYNTRKPGRFSFRRGPSHWLTIEVGTTPIVLRLNGRTYEQVLKTLSGRGVNVERNP